MILVTGDYGTDDAHEAFVASWDPAFVIATGDDYYRSAGGTGTGKYDESTGTHYGTWLKDISTTGGRRPIGKATTVTRPTRLIAPMAPCAQTVGGDAYRLI